MKVLTISFQRVILAWMAVVMSLTVMAQSTKYNEADRKQVVKSMIDSHEYVFKAQTVHPSRGRTVQLNAEYDLQISDDTVRSYLPYFGRAYSAPIGSRGGGYDFTSRQFEYVQNKRKKGGWDILVRPRDVNDVREMYLTVFENGSASLRVVSNNREPISYNGFIEMK